MTIGHACTAADTPNSELLIHPHRCTMLLSSAPFCASIASSSFVPGAVPVSTSCPRSSMVASSCRRAFTHSGTSNVPGCSRANCSFICATCLSKVDAKSAGADSPAVSLVVIHANATMTPPHHDLTMISLQDGLRLNAGTHHHWCHRRTFVLVSVL